jgi:hypothetical protein
MEPHITVRKAYDYGLDNMKFRRAMVGARMELWTKLKELCGQVTFSDTQNKLFWLLTKSGQFSTKYFILGSAKFWRCPTQIYVES